MSVGSIFESLFSCSHARLTRPITPVSKPGEPSGETYVVCLACGRQFAYDWNRMKIGKRIERSPDTGVLRPEMPGAAKAKIKYALAGSILSMAVLLGGALVTKRNKKQSKPEGMRQRIGSHADGGQRIELPHGGPGAWFRVPDLIEYIERSGRDYIIEGEVDCALADHPRPSSLDYWLREKFARNKETKQATSEVIARLVATGLFEELENLRCPDSGQRCTGLKLKPPQPIG